MKLRLARFFYRFTLWWSTAWSLIYRFFAQPKWKYRKVVLESNHNPQSAWRRVKILEYRKDDWTTLRHAINRPEHVQMSLNCKETFGMQPDGPMDCDDYAIWCVSVIEEKWQPYMLCVSWQNSNGSFEGHAVCLIQNRQTGEYHHVGNWGLSYPYSSYKDLISAIMGEDSKLVGWSIFSKNLRLIKWSTKMPCK